MPPEQINQDKLSTPFGHGALPSPLDIRDREDSNLTYAFPFPTKYSTDISVIVPNNVKNQRQLGVCTASLTYYIEYLYWKKTGVYVKLSMAFLYLITKRYIDGNITEGSALRSALKAAQKYGVCTEATFPSNFDQPYQTFIAQEIPKEAMYEAMNYKIGEYTSIPIEPSLLAGAIYKYGMLYARVVIGYEWWSPSWAQSDIDPIKPPKQPIGGHAVNLFGYDDSGLKSKNYGINTWTKQWDNEGTFSIVYEDYKPNLTEAWAVTLDPVLPPKVDNSPTILESVWRRFIQILKDLSKI